jgi:hypothetical protein
MPMCGRRPAEVHVIVSWDAKRRSGIEEHIEKYVRRNNLNMEVVKSAEVSLTEKEFEIMCFAMYVKAVHVNYHKKCHPFGMSIGVIAIRDDKPRYGWQTPTGPGSHQNLNLNMHHLKQSLQAKLGDQRLLHSSVNVEEALLTLKPIGWEDCLLKRPVFHSFTALFQMLDENLPLKYVVLVTWSLWRQCKTVMLVWSARTTWPSS